MFLCPKREPRQKILLTEEQKNIFSYEIKRTCTYVLMSKKGTTTKDSFDRRTKEHIQPRNKGNMHLCSFV